jgi:hypothetical protein
VDTQVDPPQLSPDGHWWWTGAEWIPSADRPVETPVEPVAAVRPVQADYGQPHPSERDGLALASLVCSLLIFSLPLGSITAIVTGLMSRRKAKRDNRATSRFATAGIALGSLGVTLAVGLLAGLVIHHHQAQDVHTDTLITSDLRAVADAEKTYFTNEQTYTVEMGQLHYKPSPEVQVVIVSAPQQGFCLQGDHSHSPNEYYYSSQAGGLTYTPCS